MKIANWPTCPWCDEPLNDEVVRTTDGRRAILYCTCDRFLEIEDLLVEHYQDED